MLYQSPISTILSTISVYIKKDFAFLGTDLLPPPLKQKAVWPGQPQVIEMRREVASLEDQYLNSFFLRLPG